MSRPAAEGLEDHLSHFFSRYYLEQGRWFPWRDSSTTPFGLLIAEMLLRQTSAYQVAPVWPVLIDQYPSPFALANADPAVLFRQVSSLGLGNRRVIALQDAARAILEHHGAQVPSEPDILARVPHVGLYAAHAVACFSFDARVPVVDSNILRVFGRLFGVDLGKDNRRSSVAWDTAWACLPASGPVKNHNYGLLDFSAQVCRARGLLPPDCPLAKHCCQQRSRACSQPPDR